MMTIVRVFFIFGLIAPEIFCQVDEPKIRAERFGESTLVVTGVYYEDHCSAVATGDGLVIIDTLESPRATREARGLVEGFSSEPVRYLINTHIHGDHTWGNQVFREAVIIAHANVQRRWDAEAESTKRTIENTRNQVKDLEKQLAEAQPGSEEAKRIEAELQGARFYDEGFSDLELTKPTLFFEGRVKVVLGDKSFELLYLGPAHSDTDIVIYVPEEKMLFMGDLLLPDLMPYVATNIGGTFKGWMGVLERVLELYPEAERIVPGHFGVTDVDAVRRQLKCMRDLWDAVAEAKEKGLTLEQTIESVKLEEYSHYQWYEQMLPANITIVWGEME